MKVVPFSEAYTALERKVVEAWFASNSAITSFAGQEQLKFCVDHAVFVDPTLVIVNLAKWNSLSKSAQNALQKTMMDHCAEFGRLNTEDETKSIEVCKKAGISTSSCRRARPRPIWIRSTTPCGPKWKRRCPGAFRS